MRDALDEIFGEWVCINCSCINDQDDTRCWSCKADTDGMPPEPEDECICITPSAGPTDIDPPTPRRNKHCPVHGNKAARDPDAAYEEMRDRQFEDDR
jgi:hypothetical protein